MARRRPTCRSWHRNWEWTIRLHPFRPKGRDHHSPAAADACVAILKPIDAYKTTFPNKVFDYMCAGRPVVLAIDGVIREVVEAAGCGLFTPPGDPQSLAETIRKLASDPAGNREMGMKGRRYAGRAFQSAESGRKTGPDHGRHGHKQRKLIFKQGIIDFGDSCMAKAEIFAGNCGFNTTVETRMNGKMLHRPDPQRVRRHPKDG